MSAIDWNLARAFCATADAGSMSAAARRLGLTQPTLSRQVAALEAGLGVTLFERIGKRLVLTTVGLGLLDHARAMSAAADSFALAAAGQSQDLTGGVSISATDAVSVHILPNVVARLRHQAPCLAITVVATDALSDLRRREADIAIRHLRPTEPELIGRLIGDMKAHLYAAESWTACHGAPQSAADLVDADFLAFDPVDRFRTHLGDWGVPITTGQCRIISDNAVVLWEMLRRGLGVGMMLEEVASRMPDLVRLLPDRPAVPVPVWLVTHRELHTSSRIRLVFDIVAEELRRIVTGAAKSVDRDEGALPS